MNLRGERDRMPTHRQERHRHVSGSLQPLSDEDLLAVLSEAIPLGSGIGGTRSMIDINGETVFVKQVPLTDVEGQIANTESTRDLFGMPSGCQYGVGSPGFGVWREVAANTIATGLAINGGLGCFATMYHWRVLDGPASDAPLADELADVDTFVSHWHDSVGVRQRVEAIAAATAHVAIFLEYVPTTLPHWLRDQMNNGADSVNDAIDRVELFCIRDVAAMNDAGLFHFDAHFDNMLVNDEQILLADFGLAMSSSFELSQAEHEFLRRNASHDLAHTLTRLVDWLVTEFVEPSDIEGRDRVIEGMASTGRVFGLTSASARRVIERYAPIASVINGFYSRLHAEDRRTEYPTTAILQACSKAGLVIPGTTEGQKR